MSESATSELDGGGEAAKWRRKLRAAEAERDQLAARIEHLQRQQVEALLTREQVTADAVWAVGTQLVDLLDADGAPDPGKVTAAANAAREQLGITITPGLYVPAEGRIPAPPTTSGFTAAFTPKENR